MSPMTEEQRRRMEENRKKALEKRAASMAKDAAAAARNNPTSNSNMQQPCKVATGTGMFRSEATSSSAVCRSNVTPKPVGIPAISNVGSSNSSSSKSVNTTLHANKADGAGKGTYCGSTVLSGTSVMVSRERFMVDIGFNQQLIDVFRSVGGHQYDASMKKWNFPISEHAALMTAVAGLRPMITIGPLPYFILKAFRNVKPGVPRSIPETDLTKIDSVLVNALMPFQQKGVQFGISRNGRCLISDDMGLGKSIQALGIAHFYYHEWPMLIVCPSSVRYTWRESIWRFLPSVPAGSISVIETSKDSVENSKILITSYDMLQRRSEHFAKCQVIIMDESHHLKNPKTARVKAAHPLMTNAKRLILLSGTPALSRPIELYTQISVINRTVIPQVQEFGIRYCSGKKNAWGWDFSGSSNMQELQLFLEETIMIRRLKSDVLKQLPAKLRKVMVLDPTLVRTKNNKVLKATAAAFQQGKHLKAMERRGKLLEYYSETANAKLDAVNAYLKDLLENDKKFICFAHHRTMLDGICEMLEGMNKCYIRIDGSTIAEDRQKSVEMFQLQDDIKVAILSITAANAGITLTAAKMVIFAELYWNPGILTQAEDRAHRIGQEDSVLVEYLVAGDTADDVLWPMIQEKLTVLNRAGLTKDNFEDADATALVQRSIKGSDQPRIDDFFLTEDELQNEKDLRDDKTLLDQMLDDSFS